MEIARAEGSLDGLAELADEMKLSLARNFLLADRVTYNDVVMTDEELCVGRMVCVVRAPEAHAVLPSTHLLDRTRAELHAAETELLETPEQREERSRRESLVLFIESRTVTKKPNPKGKANAVVARVEAVSGGKEEEGEVSRRPRSGGRFADPDRVMTSMFKHRWMAGM